ncbi:hypothetical protein G6F57_013851 [Rhizopus arrhizus]|nr:hypothetical protein G6F31_014590 [Rhizopus arrhizus]KAG1462918.1 hypothetical protein G6F57_013851 [Rhizopus arrhizus]KAG1597643.1 hypothetical protein G6F46_014266 [Rhizopus delemar]
MAQQAPAERQRQHQAHGRQGRPLHAGDPHRTAGRPVLPDAGVRTGAAHRLHQSTDGLSRAPGGRPLQPLLADDGAAGNVHRCWHRQRLRFTGDRHAQPMVVCPAVAGGSGVPAVDAAARVWRQQGVHRTALPRHRRRVPVPGDLRGDVRGTGGHFGLRGDTHGVSPLNPRVAWIF